MAGAAGMNGQCSNALFSKLTHRKHQHGAAEDKSLALLADERQARHHVEKNLCTQREAKEVLLPPQRLLKGPWVVHRMDALRVRRAQ